MPVYLRPTLSLAGIPSRRFIWKNIYVCVWLRNLLYEHDIYTFFFFVLYKNRRNITRVFTRMRSCGMCECSCAWCPCLSTLFFCCVYIRLDRKSGQEMCVSFFLFLFVLVVVVITYPRCGWLCRLPDETDKVISRLSEWPIPTPCKRYPVMCN